MIGEIGSCRETFETLKTLDEFFAPLVFLLDVLSQRHFVSEALVTERTLG